MKPQRDNYLTQAQSAKALFLTYDQDALIRKFRLRSDPDYLYMTMLRLPYRIDRSTGNLEKQVDGVWRGGNSYNEVMTLFDYLCDAREERFLTGRWKSMERFGLMFHRELVESRDAAADFFDRDPDALRRACRVLGGEELSGADIGFTVELFDDFPVAVQFWHSDDEFAARLRFLWDENALLYLRYETMWFAASLLRARLLG